MSAKRWALLAVLCVAVPCAWGDGQPDSAGGQKAQARSPISYEPANKDDAAAVTREKAAEAAGGWLGEGAGKCLTEANLVRLTDEDAVPPATGKTLAWLLTYKEIPIPETGNFKGGKINLSVVVDAANGSVIEAFTPLGENWVRKQGQSDKTETMQEIMKVGGWELAPARESPKTKSAAVLGECVGQFGLSSEDCGQVVLHFGVLTREYPYEWVKGPDGEETMHRLNKPEPCWLVIFLGGKFLAPSAGPPGGGPREHPYNTVRIAVVEDPSRKVANVLGVR